MQDMASVHTVRFPHFPFAALRLRFSSFLAFSALTPF
jgi:hypothetical protein